MKLVSQLGRLLLITRVMIRYGLDDLALTVPRLSFLKPIYRLAPWKWKKREAVEPAVAVRRALEDLGPVFVKFGQILSTRRDMLPERYANELAQLQDNVPPFPTEQAIELIKVAFAREIELLGYEF